VYGRSWRGQYDEREVGFGNEGGNGDDWDGMDDLENGPACQVLKRDVEVPGMIGVIEVCEEILLVPSCMKYAPRMTCKMVLKDDSKRKDLKKGSVFWVL